MSIKRRILAYIDDSANYHTCLAGLVAFSVLLASLVGLGHSSCILSYLQSV